MNKAKFLAVFPFAACMFWISSCGIGANALDCTDKNNPGSGFLLKPEEESRSLYFKLKEGGEWTRLAAEYTQDTIIFFNQLDAGFLLNIRYSINRRSLNFNESNPHFQSLGVRGMEGSCAPTRLNIPDNKI